MQAILPEFVPYPQHLHALLREKDDGSWALQSISIKKIRT
jgi:hypothetical protein